MKKGIKRLLVFPTDPLIAYIKKGEVKERYYNPANYFDEIHVISRTDKDKEASVKDVQIMFGDAKVVIHTVGDHIPFFPGKNPFWGSYLNKILKIAENIKPDVIRAYDPVLRGFLAYKCSKKLNIPFVVSVHTDYDDTIRKGYLRKKYISGILFYYLVSPFIERLVIKKADEVIAVYDAAFNYAKKHRNDIHLIYNRVYSSFKKDNKKALDIKEPSLIWVGRMDPIKGHEFLIRMMPFFNGKLILVGDGPLKRSLIELAEKLGVRDKVIFTGKVENDKLYRYYNSASMFISPSLAHGISIPIIEASVCELPICYVIPPSGYIPDILKDKCLAVKRNPKEAALILNDILKDKEKLFKLKEKAKKLYSMIKGEEMEEKEALIYRKLLERKSFIK